METNNNLFYGSNYIGKEKLIHESAYYICKSFLHVLYFSSKNNMFAYCLELTKFKYYGGDKRCIKMKKRFI